MFRFDWQSSIFLILDCYNYEDVSIRVAIRNQGSRINGATVAEEARHRRWIPCLSPLSLYTRNLARGSLPTRVLRARFQGAFTGSQLVNQACCGNSARTGNSTMSFGQLRSDERRFSLNPATGAESIHANAAQTRRLFFHASETADARRMNEQTTRDAR